MSETVQYKATIIETSRDFTARERLFIKDTSTAFKLDSLEADQELSFRPVDYAILNVESPKAEKPYNTYVVVDEDGNKYVTGSESFWKAFDEIWEEMYDETEEYKIKVYKKESKNYQGKMFITCSIE